MDILVILGGLFLAFVLGRELACWYFKINETLGVLKKIEKHLRDPELSRGNPSEMD